MTTTYTETLKLAKPDFRSPDWAPAMQNNFDLLDTAIRNLLINATVWANATAYTVGKVVVDSVDNPITFWICAVNHTSATSPTLFSANRTANPTYWTSYSFGFDARGAWNNSTAYKINDIAYDSVRGITGIAHTAHTSNASTDITDDAAYWDFIVNLPTVFTALATSYDNSTSFLAATNVQAAINEIQANVAGAYIASNTVYDNAISGLTANRVKTAIDELKVDHDSNLTLINANAVATATGLISTGFVQWSPTSAAQSGWVVANGLTLGDASSGATGRANVDTAALYAWHWNNFSNTDCPVLTGRGANAAADFAAHKTITVLDMKGNGIVGVDTMGGSATTRLNGVPVNSGSITVAYSNLGSNIHILTLAQLPTGITAANASQAISVTSSDILVSGTATTQFNPTVTPYTYGINNAAVAQRISTGNNAISVTSNNTSGNAHNNLQLVKTGYWFIKL